MACGSWYCSSKCKLDKRSQVRSPSKEYLFLNLKKYQKKIKLHLGYIK